MFIKYVFTTMKEKKIRFVIILLSVCITSALLYITLFANHSVEEDSRKSLTSEYGETDLIIQSDNSEEGYLLSEKITDKNIEESIRVCQLKGAITVDEDCYDLTMVGLAESERNKVIDVTVLDSIDKEGITISKKFSEKNKIKLGDTVSINFNQQDYEYKVSAIADNTGFFYDESYSIKVIMDIDETNELIQCEDKYTVCYCALKNESAEERDKTIESLNKKYDELKITIVDSSLVAASLNSNLTIPLIIILVVSCIMSFLILYTTASIILYERIPVIGTFLSVGLTKARIIGILLMESLIYGALGGLLGLGIGVITSELLTNETDKAFSSAWWNEIEFDALYGLISLAFAILISLLSIYVGVRRIKKIQIKAIILNMIDDQVKEHHLIGEVIKCILPVLLAGIALFFKDTVVYSALIIVAVILLVIVVLPIIVRFLSSKLPKKMRFSTPYMYVALKNVGTTKMLMNNMKLIIITLSITLLVSTISSEVITGFDGLFKGYDSDVTILMDEESQEVYDYVEDNKDIKNYYYFYSYNAMNVKGSSSPITLVQGVELDKYTTFNTYFTYENEDIMTKLDTDEKNILLSLALLDKYNKKVGDYIELEKPDKKYVKYKIVGEFNAKMAYLGSFALISIDNMKKDFDITYPNSISMKLKEGVDIKGFYEDVKKSSIGNIISGIALESDKKDRDIAMTSSFISTIENVSIITIILAAIGILNNIVISFIQRKKVFAVYDSIGISKNKKMLVMLYEGIIMAFICVLVSYLSSFAIIGNVDGILKQIGVYIDITFNTNKFIIFAAIAVADVIISSIAMVLKIKKMSIINELRYE